MCAVSLAATFLSAASTSSPLPGLDDKDKQPARVIKAHDRAPVALFVCPGADTLVTSDGINVRVWNAATGHAEQEWTLPLPATSFALSADGRYLAAGNANSTVFIFRMPHRTAD